LPLTEKFVALLAGKQWGPGGGPNCLLNSDDIDNVKKVQAGYKVQTLSSFLGKPAPAAVPKVDFLKPISADQERSSPGHFNVPIFVLQFYPTTPPSLHSAGQKRSGRGGPVFVLRFDSKQGKLHPPR
jgi:hypothetical protein